MVYTAQFSPDKKGIIAAGGTGLNSVRLVDTISGALVC